MWHPFKPAVERIATEFRGRPNLRQVYMPILPEAPEPGLSGEPFQAGKSYFTVRMVELRLATAGRYLTEFLPMCTCCLSFSQAGQRRSIPFIAGADMIRNLVGPEAPADAARHITFANLTVASNIPVPGSDVMMYLSLCRFKDSSLVRGLLNLAAKTASAVAGPAAGAILTTATALTTGLMDVVKTDGVETRFGRLDGKALGKSGYWLLAASDDAGLEAGELIISDGQLLRLSGANKQAINDVDYLVMAFEHRATLVEDTFSLVEALPFHSQWRAVNAAISRGKGDPNACETEMTELRSAVLLSPDITECDRLPLLQLYDAKREQLEAQFRPRQKAGGYDRLLGSLQRRIASEQKAGSEIGPILDAAAAAMAEAIAAPRDAAGEAPSGAEMAVTFGKIIEGQRQQLADATGDQLAAAARAYATAAARA